MIDEDMEMMRLIKMKQDQSKFDMSESLEAKRRKVKDETELNEYENQLLKEYILKQQEREADIR